MVEKFVGKVRDECTLITPKMATPLRTSMALNRSLVQKIATISNKYYWMTDTISAIGCGFGARLS